MARLPRFVIPGQPQHVILRGNNRAEIFCTEADYSFFMEKLQLACGKRGGELHAYVLMTNHVHLLMTPQEENSSCMRYIELNPVRAEMVVHPADYPWSSYHYNAVGQSDDLVTPHLEYRRLGKIADERQSAYGQLFKHRVSEQSLNEIREFTNKAWVLGNDGFKRRIQKQLARRVEPSVRGGDRKSKQFKIDRV